MEPLQILIVEDNLIFRKTLRTVLLSKLSALQISEAGNAKETLEKIKGRRPDIIFMDINLPDGNGLQLTKVLTNLCPQAKVAIISIHDSPEYVQAAKESGAEWFLSKTSSTPQEIVDIVTSHFPE